MNTQTVFKVGNSLAITIPSEIVHELNFRKSQKVSVEYIPENNSILVRPVWRRQKKNKRSEREFKAWLASFLEEDNELLDELAHR